MGLISNAIMIDELDDLQRMPVVLLKHRQIFAVARWEQAEWTKPAESNEVPLTAHRTKNHEWTGCARQEKDFVVLAQGLSAQAKQRLFSMCL